MMVRPHTGRCCRRNKRHVLIIARSHLCRLARIRPGVQVAVSAAAASGRTCPSFQGVPYNRPCAYYSKPSRLAISVVRRAFRARRRCIHSSGTMLLVVRTYVSKHDDKWPFSKRHKAAPMQGTQSHPFFASIHPKRQMSGRCLLGGIVESNCGGDSVPLIRARPFCCRYGRTSSQSVLHRSPPACQSSLGPRGTPCSWG
jgi:hypothetical protein